FNPKKAAATTAFIVIFSSFSGFLGHVSLGNIDIKLLIFCAIGSIAGALFGAYLMKKKLSGKQVKIAIGLILYIIAVKMVWDLIK
ncbi:MAG: sulfite exporter TauE/SafE family protein, partial [Nitrospirae bacterium]|nr:sulfite exporter TauE/SafE family protein [Nitrospirota bacterium]